MAGEPLGKGSALLAARGWQARKRTVVAYDVVLTACVGRERIRRNGAAGGRPAGW